MFIVKTCTCNIKPSSQTKIKEKKRKVSNFLILIYELYYTYLLDKVFYKLFHLCTILYKTPYGYSLKAVFHP